MILVIKRDVAKSIGFDTLTDFGVSRKSWETWRERQDIDLGNLSRERLDALESRLQEHKRSRGVGVLLSDIANWKRVLEEGSEQRKARTVRQFEPLLVQYLLHVPGHRIYQRHEEGANLCFTVSDVVYQPPIDHGDRRRPAAVIMGLLYESLGGRHERHVYFHSDDCLNVPVGKVLLDAGYLVETPELRAEFLAYLDRYGDVANAVGKQYLGRGIGERYADRDDRWHRASNDVQLDRYGEPARVVVDVFQEDGKAQGGGSSYVDPHTWFWPNAAKKTGYNPETDEAEGVLDEDDALETPEIEWPIHPWVIVYDLKRHVRLKVHVAQLEEYVYDTTIADKLILPDDTKELIKLLIETKGGAFKDLVKGKSGGAVVLLCGPPGTGKTLTAEVYAESEQRALYSVQCSQLGVKPETLEAELQKVFERAQRWNAVLLLDEADVYVRERGGDIQQNAIVGVFLRVLEYQASTMFLTTNRPDDVDDAIASRCIARLDYSSPDPVDARRIWRVLADNASLSIADKSISEIVEANAGMSGRDVKNVLKLASLMATRFRTDKVTPQAVEYVKQFRPTGRRES